MSKQKFKDHHEFFHDVGESYIQIPEYGGSRQIMVEELYQHFRARLLEEMELNARIIRVHGNSMAP